MATKKRRTTTTTPQSIERQELEELIYQYGGLTRFTQDSPVLPDVWFEFGKNPTARLDLLLNPHFEASPGRVAQVIEERLVAERKAKVANKFRCDDDRGPDIAYNQSTVVVRLCFHELVRVVLPLTPWWNNYVWTGDGKELQQFLSDKKTRQVLARAIDGDMSNELLKAIDPQVIWMMRVIGTIGAAATGRKRTLHGDCRSVRRFGQEPAAGGQRRLRHCLVRNAKPKSGSRDLAFYDGRQSRCRTPAIRGEL